MSNAQFTTPYMKPKYKEDIVMDKMFENFGICRRDGDNQFMVVCRDREKTTEERWVVATLSTDEMKQIYEYLSKYF